MEVCLCLNLVLLDGDVALVCVCLVDVREVNMCGHLVRPSVLRQRPGLGVCPDRCVALPASDPRLTVVVSCSGFYPLG